MSKKNREGVKHSIQELATGNYKSYPDEYGVAGTVAVDNVRSLAKGYWDSREYKEIERDERLGIQLEDYQQWTQEALVAFRKQYGNSMN
ncbi:MAG TPA: hypothetical protein VJ720_09115 [Chitinophaga sp.]|nr:hypothetical protein [Chitinophaga sp.]